MLVWFVLLSVSCSPTIDKDWAGWSGADRTPQLYAVPIAFVHEYEEGGPILCLHELQQCEGLPLINWSWKDVKDEERDRYLTRGIYRLTGTFDGTSFTVATVDDPGPFPPPEDLTNSPCPPPPGGWHPYPQDAFALRGSGKATQTERGGSDFAGMWISYFYASPKAEAAALEAVAAGRYDDGPETVGRILNVAFTGYLERHEANLRKKWHGSLCVVRHRHSFAELNQILEDLDDVAEELDIDRVGGGIDESRDAVTLDAVLVTGDDQAALDARFGKGAVLTTSVLQPLR